MNWNDFKRQGKESFPPKTILSILAGTAILAFGMVNIHKRVHITEGGVLGMILLLNYWFAIPTSLLSPILDALCYLVGFRYCSRSKFLSKILKILVKNFREIFPEFFFYSFANFNEKNSNFEELNQNLGALNDSGAIKGMDAREDGVYITYTPVAGADTVTKKLGSGISFRWKYAGQPNVVSGTIQQISEIDVSNYTFATFAVHTNSANLDINILGNGTAISSFKTGTQKLNVNEYTSISANFAVKYNLPATIDITITLD